MVNNERFEKIILFSLCFLICFSYLLGFYLNENSAGGGEGDFRAFTFNNIQFFNSNSLLETFGVVNNDDTGKLFRSSRIPGVYVFHKFFNPFTDNPYHYRLSVFLFSLLVPIIFYFCLKLKFKDTKKIYLIFLSSLVLLSPYFRTSAIWGNEENFAYITLVLSYFFLLKYLDSNKERKIIFLSLLIIFSSLCVYFDQKFLIVPAICFLTILFKENKLYYKIYTIFLYFVFSLPIFYLIYLWGGLLPPVDQIHRDVHINKYNFQNLGYALTIISFYLAPFIFYLFLSNRKEVTYPPNKIEIIFYILFILYVIFFIFFYDILNEERLGKGILYKLAVLITNNTIFQKILISIGILVSLRFMFIFFQNTLVNFFTLLFLVLTPILYKPILQEYYDPLIFLLIFTFLTPKFSINLKSLMILFIYFSLFLSFANIYYSKVV